MPKKGYQQTEEHKRKIGLAGKGKKHGPMSEAGKKKRSEALKGRPHSAEHNARVSASLIGRKRAPFSDEWLQHMSEATRKAYAEGRRSRERSAEHRRRIGETRRRRGIAKGSKNPNWKGGRTMLGIRLRNSDEYKNWRTQVFERDGSMCQRCGIEGNGKNLQAHHETPLSVLLEERAIGTVAEALKCGIIWDVTNGITLCIDCHRTTNSYGWRVWNERLRLEGGAMA